MRVELQPAFILHSRPFSDSSLIVDCLTQDHGRLSLLAKGARSQKSRQRQLLQPFNSLSISWQGKSDLKTLTHAEIMGGYPTDPLQGHFLYSAFYINELLVRLLPEKDFCGGIYQLYHQLLKSLYANEHLESQLRNFELRLLQELGYGVQFDRDIRSGLPIRPDCYYRFVREQGFEVTHGSSSGEVMFWGAHLQSIALGDFRDDQVLLTAKKFSRMALHPYLGSKPLQSRKLFSGMAKGKSE